MRILTVFVAITILVLTVVFAAVKPEVHKQFILTNPDFKISNLSQKPADLQSVPLFRLGETPVQISEVKTPPVAVSTDAPIIPSDVKIIPSDFIQQVPVAGAQNQNAQPAQNVNNSDKVLEQVEKMLNTEVVPKSENVQENRRVQESSSSDNRRAEVTEDESPATCSICDQLKNPRFRSELIAWNKWRSDLQNTIMDLSSVDAPYGTLFFFSFKVDNNRRISNVKVISTRPNMNTEINSIRSTIITLNGSDLLKFPQGTRRKSVNFSGGFLMSDYEQFSSPEDFRDFEYVQSF